MNKIDGLTEQQARDRLDEAAERLKAMGVILVRDKEKVPKKEEYKENFR